MIYLLDGDSFFHSLVGISKTFSTVRGKFLPQSIIIGVLNVDRTRDLTPTASAAGRDGKIAPGAIPQGGGSETFSRFLTGELRAVIDSTYRTNGKNMLIGHSYAGLFTLNTFLRHTERFDTYLAVDPSLWWDQGKLAEEADALIEGKDFAGKSLYIGVASKKRTDRVDIHLNKVNHLLTEVLPQAETCASLVNHSPKRTTEQSLFREYTTGSNNYSENEKIICSTAFMVIHTFRYHHCDRLPNGSHTGI